MLCNHMLSVGSLDQHTKDLLDLPRLIEQGGESLPGVLCKGELEVVIEEKNIFKSILVLLL